MFKFIVTIKLNIFKKKNLIFLKHIGFNYIVKKRVNRPTIIILDKNCSTIHIYFSIKNIKLCFFKYF